MGGSPPLSVVRGRPCRCFKMGVPLPHSIENGGGCRVPAGSQWCYKDYKDTNSGLTSDSLCIYRDRLGINV